jgi:hypothetical protein
MAAGDGNRVWFPEMIEMLRSQWNAGMPFPALIELCNTLDEMFQRRRPRGLILSPGSLCPECGRIVPFRQRMLVLELASELLSMVFCSSD